MPNELFPKKHLFVVMEERCGKYTCTSPTLLTVDANVLPRDAAEVAAKNWHGDDGVKNCDGAWAFRNGAIVSVCKVIVLPISDYETLKCYIGEFEVELRTENYYAKN